MRHNANFRCTTSRLCVEHHVKALSLAGLRICGCYSGDTSVGLGLLAALLYAPSMSLRRLMLRQQQGANTVERKSVWSMGLWLTECIGTDVGVPGLARQSSAW